MASPSDIYILILYDDDDTRASYVYVCVCASDLTFSRKSKKEHKQQKKKTKKNKSEPTAATLEDTPPWTASALNTHTQQHNRTEVYANSCLAPTRLCLNGIIIDGIVHIAGHIR